MKKLCALLLSLTLCLSLLPAAMAAAGPIEVGYGEAIDHDALFMTIAETAVTPKLQYQWRSGNSTRTATVSGQSGMQIVYLTGQLLNRGGTNITNKTFAKQMTVNGQTYTAFLYLVNAESAETFTELAPGQAATYCLYAYVPDADASDIRDFSLAFGFNDDLSDAMPGEVSDAGSQYILNGMGAAETVPELPAAEIQAPAEPDIRFTPVAEGDTLTLDFAEIVIGAPTYAAEIREGGSVSYVHPAQTEGNVIYWLPITLKNTTGNGYQLSGWRTMAELVFDGTYTYEGRMENLYGGSAKSMDPLVENHIYIYAEIPQSLAESCQSVSIRFGFNEGFGEYDVFNDTMAELDYRYEYTVGDPVPGAKQAADDAQELALGDSIQLDFVTITPAAVAIEDEIYPEDTSGVYLYIQDTAGSQYICLSGRMKNLAGENLDGRYFNGQITVNDTYTYDAVLSIAADPATTTNYALAPLQEATFYLYASVPDDAVELLQTGAVTMRFNDMFARETNGYAYSYKIPFTK